MSRFFFDTDNGVHHVRDEIGLDLVNDKEAAVEALGLLRDLAHVNFYVGKHMLTAQVRDADGVAVYRATMVITGERP